MRQLRRSLRVSSVLLLAVLSGCALETEPTDNDTESVEDAPPAESEARTTGILRTPFGVQEVEVEIMNGRKIFDGDIDLGPAISSEDDVTPYAALKTNLWPNATVYYQWGSISDTDVHDAFEDAMAEIERKTPINFVEGTGTGSYLKLKQTADDEVSHSKVGMIGGEQEVEIRSDRNYKKSIATHELLHSLGFIHEQSRSDRDDYIYVHYECISSSKADQYDANLAVSTYGPYDHDSIMHYAPNQFNTGCQTMTRLYDNNSNWETFDSYDKPMSAGDVNAIWWLYGSSGLQNASGDNFGKSIATGDFDGDGIRDVAVGIPYDDTEGVSNAGRVRIFKGTPLGLVPWMSIEQPWLGQTNEVGDRFGEVLKSADFDNDGFADLAVGAPHEDYGSNTDSGAVFLFRGTDAGLTAYTTLTQTQTGVDDDSANDNFGAAIAWGNFDGSGNQELAVGAPGNRATSTSTIKSGAVFVFHLTSLTSTQMVSEAGYSSSAQAGDEFGASLAGKDIDGDGYDDLVAGTPERGSGAVYVLRGTSSTTSPLVFKTRLTSSSMQRFGFSVAIGNFDASGNKDIAVGAPGDVTSEGGRVFVFNGTGATLATTGSFSSATTIAQTSGENEVGDEMGYDLAVGDVIGSSSSASELAIGVPGENSGAGRVIVYKGTSSGLTWLEEFAGGAFPGQGSAAGDRFGENVAIGSVDGFGPELTPATNPANMPTYSDIIVGAPKRGAGRIFLALGGSSALTKSSSYDQESP